MDNLYFDNKNIPYQISGGFAAKLHGSKRELADIDIEIGNDDFEKIIPEIKNYLIYGPESFKDQNWDLKLATLKYKEQLIDICGEANIFDQNTKKWVKDTIDFSHAVDFEIYGIKIKVTSKADLIAYKSKLQREVDKQDIEAISLI